MPSRYNRYLLTTKLRVLKAARTGGDWETVPETNGVKLNTARSWLRRYRAYSDVMQAPPRGGKRTQKK
ncbi:hypothetical protein GN244_ATG13314 [Phytophthora infestans]|uniref:Uncharacterized protein n=1 Tax=Phytophthora infestans TaxID=4787 RepID=A0A833WRF7_PHYIN|nr:hypothetical protein GN244_ATG13314 [Phytophthora infestans]